MKTKIRPLQANAARRLCDWVLALLRLYSEHNLGLVTVAPGAALAGERSAEASRGLRALLRLLTQLTARDVLDFGTQPGQEPVDVAQVSNPLGFGAYCPVP